ncbi:MAG: ABC transporter permease [Pirellulales bacterium]|nr:ABC transporter permease [Pirellulales bacterium]
MVLETEPLPFGQWLPEALNTWLQVVGLLALAALLLAFFIAAVRNGPVRALEITLSGLGAALGDLLRISPRRVIALARLSIKEAIHRRVLVAFGVFILVLLFAGWFLDTASDEPARLYLSFVLTTTSYLALLLGLFVSVFSLPSDIQNRTIYTVVTKPVRPSELVLGRMLGFGAVGTAMLAVTGVVSYFFVVRGLDHTHTIVASRMTPISAEEDGGFRGQTELASNHRHQVFVDANGVGRTDTEQGHYHGVRQEGDQFVVTPPIGMLVARVPIYGKLAFRDRTGSPIAKGVNVGEEWTYRSYIEGGTLATAVWGFDNLSADQLAGGLPIEMTIRVFRTHKGDIEKGILGSLVLRNPQTGKASAARNFIAKEFTTDVHHIPARLSDADGNPLDLYRDLVADGRLQVELQCLQPGQYFGMAQPDVYIRASDASFTQNFIKGYLGMWLQMMLVTAAGVMFSTFLNGAVAMLATLAGVIAGFFIPFLQQISTGTFLGGGPVEALYRIVSRMNVTVPLEPGPGTTFINMCDQAFRFALGKVLAIVPDFAGLSNVDYVAYGFDIPADLLWTHVVKGIAYLVPIFIAGFLFFRTREVAR